MYSTHDHLVFYVLQTLMVNIKYHDNLLTDPCLPPLNSMLFPLPHQERNRHYVYIYVTTNRLYTKNKNKEILIVQIYYAVKIKLACWP